MSAVRVKKTKTKDYQLQRCWVSTRLILTFIGVTTAASTITEFIGQRFVARLCTRQAYTRPTDWRTGVSLTNPVDPDLGVRVVRSMYTGLSRRSRFCCFVVVVVVLVMGGGRGST